MNKKKPAIISVPKALPVPIVDNHTHIDTDYYTHGDWGAASVVEREGLSQRLTQDGKWQLPLLEENLIKGMEQAQIRAAITSGCEVPGLEPTLAAARRHPGKIYAALGIHPNDAALHAGVREVAPDGLVPNPKPWHEALDLPAAMERVAALVREPEVLAIGETGLDFFRTGENGKAAQREGFCAHISLAKEVDKPMQIHDRDAHGEVLEVLEREGAPTCTVFHSFSADVELASKLAEHGWYASFSGPLTYRVNKNLREAFLALPEELILVETDAPYLTPNPFRGYPNAVWGAAYTARYQAWLRLDPEAREIVENPSFTAAQIQQAVDNVSEDLVAQWCEQLEANVRTVYGI